MGARLCNRALRFLALFERIRATARIKWRRLLANVPLFYEFSTLTCDRPYETCPSNNSSPVSMVRNHQDRHKSARS